jgi:hypothetical protein
VVERGDAKRDQAVLSKAFSAGSSEDRVDERRDRRAVREHEQSAE